MNSKYSAGSVEAHKKKKPVGVGRAGGRLLDLDRRGDRQRLVLPHRGDIWGQVSPSLSHSQPRERHGLLA